MASPSLHFVTHLKPPNPRPYHLFYSKPFITLKCTSTPTNSPTQDPQPEPDDDTDGLDLVKRIRPSVINRDRKPGLVKPEPPNFEIGWKRTKEVKLEQPKGYMIMDFLEKLEGLMERNFGSTELLEKTGQIVSERAREEAEVLREEGGVDERLITELFRVLRLMEMDLAMVKAAVKEETLKERLGQAIARCRNYEFKYFLDSISLTNKWESSVKELQI